MSEQWPVPPGAFRVRISHQVMAGVAEGERYHPSLVLVENAQRRGRAVRRQADPAAAWEWWEVAAPDGTWPALVGDGDELA